MSDNVWPPPPDTTPPNAVPEDNARATGTISAICSTVGLLICAAAFCGAGLLARGSALNTLIGIGVILGVTLLLVGLISGVIGRRTTAGHNGLVLAVLSLALITGLVLFGLTHRHR